VTYATQAQLIDRYGEAMLIDLTDRGDPPSGEIDVDVVSRALADADAAIDGYLAGRYQAPLSAPPPPAVTDLALAIAIYKLHRNVASDKIRNDYTDALKMLRDISAGVASLAGVDGAAPPGSGASGVRTNQPTRPMTADTMKGFI
jgi:phage gp36-like protein